MRSVLAALLACGCAFSGTSAVEAPPPTYTRSWRAYTPEELNRDVVECAEGARSSLEQELPGSSRAKLRLALRDRTTACMEKRGWTRVSPGGS